jgi:hypothetical protein
MKERFRKWATMFGIIMLTALITSYLMRPKPIARAQTAPVQEAKPSPVQPAPIIAPVQPVSASAEKPIANASQDMPAHVSASAKKASHNAGNHNASVNVEGHGNNVHVGDNIHVHYHRDDSTPIIVPIIQPSHKSNSACDIAMAQHLRQLAEWKRISGR